MKTYTPAGIGMIECLNDTGPYVDKADYAALAIENAELRCMLAWACAGPALYHDDGELQDNREQPFIDFRRDSIDEIRVKTAERARKFMAGGGGN